MTIAQPTAIAEEFFLVFSLCPAGFIFRQPQQAKTMQERFECGANPIYC